MAHVRTSVEAARGCGFRKPGAMYLVSGGLSEPCPLLPIETAVCPTCGEGIKPARGFTWVDGAKLIPPQVHGTGNHNAVCPLSPMAHPDRGESGSRLGRCGLIWIGEQHYKTARAFMDEAARMGVSRRISAVPRDFVVGETWVLLGHRKAIERVCSECGELPEPGVVASLENLWHVLKGPDPDCPVCEGIGDEYRPGIITAFRPTAIEYIVKGDETDEELEALEKRGLALVRVERAEQEQLV